ncbi:MAG: hemerythrin domain-containing protein [Ignavibacteriota bacterium]
MPRHSSLVPLSHDHHEALLIALRLKKGGPTSQHDHLWPTDLKNQIHSLQLFFERELLPHFKLEEEILFPLASGLIEMQLLVKSLLLDHQKMREIIAEISQYRVDDSDNTDLKAILAGFGLLLESHVRTEERELFPKLEEAEKNGRIVIPVLK